MDADQISTSAMKAGSKPQPPDDIEAWLQNTVLPKKAPWIGQVGSAHELTDVLRGGEPQRGQRATPAG